jgi:pimeloyl-ACP methyl ester carboxylesterase
MAVASLQLERATLAYGDEGGGGPVVLLHGFPCTRTLWNGIASLLAAAGHRVLTPDLAGYGASAGPSDMSAQADHLLAFFDALGLERVAIVAHDVGSAAAQILTARAPGRVRKLVVIDGVHAGEWAMDAIASIRDWPAADGSRLFKLLVRRVRTSAAQGRISDAQAREVLAPYEGDEGGARLIAAARSLDPSQTASLSHELHESGVPALVLWGEHDSYLSPETVGRPLAQLLRAPFVLLPGGHFLPLELPAEVAAQLLRFLTEPE